MALSRGARTDYDAWEALGNPGWGWESMFEYFKKSSTLTYPSPELVEKYNYVVSPEGYGQGPRQAGFPKWQFPALYNFIDAWTKDIGVQYRADGNTNGENLGMAWKPIDIDPVNVTRASARKPYKSLRFLNLIARNPRKSNMVLGLRRIMGSVQPALPPITQKSMQPFSYSGCRTETTLQDCQRLTLSFIDYDPVSGRANLDILVGNYVATLVTGSDASVTGVNVARVNGTSSEFKYLRSGKDVILAAGAIHTTQILQISGIGPASLLEPLGVDVIADLPGVGANFQDHPTNIGFTFQLLNEPSLNPSLYNDATFFNASWDEYMANRTGPLTWAFGNNRVFLSLQNLINDYEDLIDDFLDINENDSS